MMPSQLKLGMAGKAKTLRINSAHGSQLPRQPWPTTTKLTQRFRNKCWRGELMTKPRKTEPMELTALMIGSGMCLTFLVITIGTLSCYVLFPPRIQTYTIPLVQSWMTTTKCGIFPQESILPRSYVGGWIEDGQNVYRLCLRTALWENRHHWVERGITRLMRAETAGQIQRSVFRELWLKG